MKTYLKKFLVAVVCVIVTFSIYLYSCMIVTPKSINDAGGALYYNGMGFLAEPENSLDIIIYGNSNVYSGVSPAVLYAQTGYTAYASGRAAQTLKNINVLLKTTLKTQKPKLVILETGCLYTEKDNQGVYDFDWLYAPFVYHARWKELHPRDFYQLPQRKHSVDLHKGYINSDFVFQTDFAADYMGATDAAPLPFAEGVEQELTEFLTLCRENQIEVMFLELTTASEWTYAKHNRVQQLADEQNIYFLDLNVPNDGFDLDFKKDFRDNGMHLNRTGAYKSSVYLATAVNARYGDLLTDKRENPNYAQWQDVVDNYQNQTV